MSHVLVNVSVVFSSPLFRVWSEKTELCQRKLSCVSLILVSTFTTVENSFSRLIKVIIVESCKFEVLGLHFIFQSIEDSNYREVVQDMTRIPRIGYVV